MAAAAARRRVRMGARRRGRGRAAARPTPASSPARASAADRSAGSIIGCGRPRVYSSAPKSTKRVRRRAHDAPGLVAERAAGEEPEHRAARLGLAARASAARAPGAPAERLDRGDGGLLEASPRTRTPAGASPRQPSRQAMTGLPAAPAAASTSRATPSAAGLETRTQHARGRVAGQELDGLQRGDARRRLGVEVPAAGPDGVRDAAAEPMDQARHLLEPGAGGADEADGAAADAIGEAEADAVDDARAALGPHHEEAPRPGAQLERDAPRRRARRR